jgi:DNA-binding LacI/PurR family transcriptional regulator
MPTTITDIARAAGVSTAAVSKILRGKGTFSKATTKRIKRIADQLGYRPNQMARALVSGRSNLVAIVTESAANPLHEIFINEIERGLRNTAYVETFYAHSGEPDRERICFEQIMQSRPAGVIAIPSDHPNLQLYRELLQRGTKMVIVRIPLPGVAVPQVICDDYDVARIATEYLISLGHRNIAHLAIPRATAMGASRERGFVDALLAAGLPARTTATIETPLSEVDGIRAMRRLLQRKSPPTAVLARQDTVALGAIAAILETGLSVPRDISVMGIGNVCNSSMYKVPLTSVHFPMQELSIMGLCRLLTWMEEQPVAPQTEALRPEIVVRSSTAPPPPGR